MRFGPRSNRARGPRKDWGSRRSSRGMMLLGWTAIGATVILVSGTLYGYAKYRAVFDSIKQITVQEPGKRPPKDPNAMNVLIIGSDSRTGKNGKIGGTKGIYGQRSDTVMIAHISPGQSKMAVLSFPRDTTVPILKCNPEPGFPGGQAAQTGVEQLNSTFAYGGPGCLWHTLETVTNIHIDDFIQIDFTGFISVINALHGVRVCLPYTIHSHTYDHFRLAAGPHVIKGYKALEFWRLREGFGLGSDLQRIQRDQLLMVSLVQKVLHSHVLGSFSKTLSIIHAITSAHALTTDTGLTQTKMVDIATGMAGINRKSVQFIEVPTVTYIPNQAWVALDQTQDPGLFSAIAHDTTLPKVVKTKKGKKGPAVKLLSAAKVNVEVLNGSGVFHIAGTTADALTTRGFHVLGSTGATTPSGATDYNYTKSVIEYRSAADLAAAQTVAAQLSDVTLKQVSTVPAGTVDLILGKDFTALKAKSSAKPLGNLASKYGGFTGNTNVCGKSNKGAFMR
jgi:LCP family protein required for cell wall assembly